jgi:hypothetical protein
VALPEGSLVVNSSQGGGSKDTWVLASRTSADRELGAAEVVRSLPKSAKGAKPDKGPEPPQQRQRQSQAQLPSLQQGQQQQQQQAMMDFR